MYNVQFNTDKSGIQLVSGIVSLHKLQGLHYVLCIIIAHLPICRMQEKRH